MTLISSARRADLRIAQDCVDLERVSDSRDPGTTITADLDPAYPIDEVAACEYLSQYVRSLPVPVRVNDRLISQESFEDTLSGRAAGFEPLSLRPVSDGGFSGTLQTSVNAQDR